jgi:hypothetical protein
VEDTLGLSAASSEVVAGAHIGKWSVDRPRVDLGMGLSLFWNFDLE